MESALSQECEQLRNELKLCKNDEVTKEASMNELKRQCQELIRSRAIECNLIVNKPAHKAQAWQQTIDNNLDSIESSA